MALNQSTIQRATVKTFQMIFLQVIKSLLLVTLCFSIFLPMLKANAEALSYGPTKSGDTLWKIAKNNLPKESVSVEQFVYSIYLSNQKAFQSGNINQLLIGVTLKMPGTDFILKTSTPDAKQRIKLFQSDAKKLARAKTNKKRFNQQIKKYSRQLRKYRRNSRAWRKTYRKLARSKRNLSVSNRKVAHLTKLIHDRANNQIATLAKEKAKGAGALNATTVKTPVSSGAITDISQQDIDETNKLLAQLEKEDEAKNINSQPVSVKNVNPRSIESKNIKNAGRRKETRGNQEITLKQATPNANNKAEVKSEQVTAIVEKQADNKINKALTSASDSNPKIDSYEYINKNFILIAGIINGIILLFVLIKLFEKKEETDFIHE